MEKFFATEPTKITVTLPDGSEFEFEAIAVQLSTAVEMGGLMTADFSYKVIGPIDFKPSEEKKGKKIKTEEMVKYFKRELEF